MSAELFSEDCYDCRPALAEVDTKTGKAVPLSEDHPMMVAVTKAYDSCSREEKEAFHKMTCQNDTSDENMKVLQPMLKKIQDATASFEFSSDPSIS